MGRSSQLAQLRMSGPDTMSYVDQRSPGPPRGWFHGRRAPPLPGLSTLIHLSHGKNVLGTDLALCGKNPLTGFHRDGCCRSGKGDVGLHLVCARMTEKFLAFSRARGNDLTTPHPEFHFPGLKPGDRWCLCVLRWKEAFEAGVAPPVVLEATHISTLEFVDLEELQQHAWTG